MHGYWVRVLLYVLLEIYYNIRTVFPSTSIIGLVVEFIVAIDEARVRFTDDAQQFLFCVSGLAAILVLVVVFLVPVAAPAQASLGT